MEFVNERPGVRVQLFVEPDNATSVEDGTDVVVSSRKPTLPGIVGHDLGAISHVICASPDYFRTAGRPKTPQDLREHNCLADPSSASRRWPFGSASRPLLVEVKGSLSSNSNAVLIDMALRGCGIIRVPLHAVKAEIVDGRLEAIFKTTSLSPERMGVYVAKAKRLPTKTAEFLKFLKASLRP